MTTINGTDSEKQFMELESTGIYEGIVQENMADTMKKHNGQRFAKIWIPELWAKDGKYPLTYVGGINNLPTLTEGMKVWIKFEQGNQLYPAVHKNTNDLKNSVGELYKPFSLSGVTNTTDKVVGGELYGNSGALQVTDKRLAIVFANTFMVLDNNSFKIYSNGGVKIHGTSGVVIENGDVSINDILSKISKMLGTINTCLTEVAVEVPTIEATIPVLTDDWTQLNVLINGLKGSQS